MGYRLEIYKIDYKLCGGKLYGYVDDVEKLESYQWLMKKRKIDDWESETWIDGEEHPIILYYWEIAEFIELYKKDFKTVHGNEWYNSTFDTKFDEVIKECIKKKETILLTWG